MNKHPPVASLLAIVLLTAVRPCPAAPAEKPVDVIIAEARMEEFADRIEALGTLSANESVSLTATVTETVSTIHFDDGDRVEQGQVLVEMTSHEEHARLEEERATVNEARRQFQRIQSLEAQGTAAKSVLDERRREWETARARLAAIESQLADRLITAPFSGVLGLRDLSVGALVQPGDLITTLDDDSIMKLDFPVPGIYMDAIHPGLEVVAVTRALQDHEFRGTVKAVNSRIDPVTRAIRVRALLPNPAHLLKPGLLLQVTLLHNPRMALLIPEEALIGLGGKQSVYVVSGADGNSAEQRDITIGGRRPGQVEVLTGLQAGDRVITHGSLKLRPGQPVNIVAVDDGARSLSELLRALPGSQARP